MNKINTDPLKKGVVVAGFLKILSSQLSPCDKSNSERNPNRWLNTEHNPKLTIDRRQTFLTATAGLILRLYTNVKTTIILFLATNFYLFRFYKLQGKLDNYNSAL